MYLDSFANYDATQRKHTMPSAILAVFKNTVQYRTLLCVKERRFINKISYKAFNLKPER